MSGSAYPPRRPGLQYLAEGGQSTQMLHGHGFDLPHFALFPLLDDPDAVGVLTQLYRAYLDAAVRHGFAALVGGLDYRASPDWGHLLGLSEPQLADYQLRSIEFLRTVTGPYEGRLPDVLVSGLVGPRSDAYRGAGPASADDAEEYHSVQIATLRLAEVDLVQAVSISSVEEAVGIARAGARAGLPVAVSFILDEPGCLRSGHTVREAVEAVDEACVGERPTYYGINCVHPTELLGTIEPGPWRDRLRCLRPNAVPTDRLELTGAIGLESGDPDELGDLVGRVAAELPGLDIWGGCCGTWDQHLDRIAGVVTHGPS